MPKNRVCATATGLPKITRRAFVCTTAATPLAAIPVVGFSQAIHDDEDKLDFLIAIAGHTGLTLDELYYWFKGINSEVVGQVMKNALCAPLPKWNKSATRSAVIGFKASEIFTDIRNPLADYCERQIRMQGDREEIVSVLKCYRSSADAYPSLMDLV